MCSEVFLVFTVHVHDIYVLYILRDDGRWADAVPTGGGCGLFSFLFTVESLLRVFNPETRKNLVNRQSFFISTISPTFGVHILHVLNSSPNGHREINKLTILITSVLQRIPGWWVWFYWISPVAWTLYGLITSQLGDVEFIMEAPGYGSVPVKDFLTVYFGYKHSMLGICVLVLFIFMMLFWVIFASSIKFLNFQNR